MPLAGRVLFFASEDSYIILRVPRYGLAAVLAQRGATTTPSEQQGAVGPSTCATTCLTLLDVQCYC